MDFGSLDPENGCFRIDGVRFVQKGHVHENVCEINENGSSNGAQKGALRQFVRHRFVDCILDAILSRFGLPKRLPSVNEGPLLLR